MADPAHEATDKLIEDIRQQVSREYLHAYKEAEAKLSDYLSRFEEKDRIHAEAVRRGEETDADYREWRRGQMLVGKRWQELVNTLAEDYRNTDRIAASIVNSYLPDAYALNHDYATFQVEQGSRVDTSYTLYDRATVERMLRDQQDLLPKAKVDGKKDKAWNRKHISSAITQGVLQGESLDKVARRLRSVAEMDHRAAMRTARTAMTSAQNVGRVDAYRRAEGMGIHVRKQWLATLDGRTRHSHRRLDGEVVGMEENFSNGLRYPGDPESGRGSEVYNCRCTLVPVVDGVDQSSAIRNSKLGGMDYEEWKDKHSENLKADVGTAGKKVTHPSYSEIAAAVDRTSGPGSHEKLDDALQLYGGTAGTGFTTGVDAIDTITEMLDKAEELKMNSGVGLFRGIGLNEVTIDTFLEENRVGNEVTMRSLSWTTSKEVADRYASTGPIKVVYEDVTEGRRDMVSIMEWAREYYGVTGDWMATHEEVLQTKKDLKFRIVSVTRVDDGTGPMGAEYLVKVEEVRRRG